MKKQLTILILCWLLASVAFGQYTATATDSFPPSQHKSTFDSLQKVADFEAFKLQKMVIINNLKDLQATHYKAITKIDARGLWISTAYGVSKSRYQLPWSVNDILDDNNNVINSDTVWSKSNTKRARTLQFNFSYRISQNWGIRAGGQHTWLDVEAAQQVKGLNDEFTYLNQNYQYRRNAANLSVEYFLIDKNFNLRNRFFLYGGAGAQWRNTVETQGFGNESSNPINSQMGKSGTENNIQPIVYLGLKAGRKIQFGVELGWEERIFHHFTLTYSLSKKHRQSVKRHQEKRLIWLSIDCQINPQYNAINEQERQLFPERFPVPKKVETPSDTDND
jgi:hypothetical protein